MRTRKEIEHDGTRKDVLLLEVLLDVRDMIIVQKPINIAKEVTKNHGGRPKGSKNKKIK